MKHADFDTRLFKERLVYARKDKGLKQEELAQMIGTSRSTISVYEKQDRVTVPDARTMKKLTEALGVEYDYLVGNSRIPDSSSRLPYYQEPEDEKPELVKDEDDIFIIDQLKDSFAWERLASYGEAYSRKKDNFIFGAPLDIIKTFVRKFPASPIPHLKLAELFAGVGEIEFAIAEIDASVNCSNYKSALDGAFLMVSDEPSNINLLGNTVILCILKGDISFASKFCDRAMKSDIRIATDSRMSMYKVLLSGIVNAGDRETVEKTDLGTEAEHLLSSALDVAWYHSLASELNSLEQSELASVKVKSACSVLNKLLYDMAKKSLMTESGENEWLIDLIKEG